MGPVTGAHVFWVIVIDLANYRPLKFAAYRSMLQILPPYTRPDSPLENLDRELAHLSGCGN